MQLNKKKMSVFSFQNFIHVLLCNNQPHLNCLVHIFCYYRFTFTKPYIKNMEHQSTASSIIINTTCPLCFNWSTSQKRTSQEKTKRKQV